MKNVFALLAYIKHQKQSVLSKKKMKLARFFGGRSKLENAAALFTFNKDGNAQKLIHTLKYEEGKNVGIFLGEQLGFAIKESEFFNNIVIAVPLHPKNKN